MANKPTIGIQVSIKKYLLSTEGIVDTEENEVSKPSSKFKCSSRKLLRLGSVTRPKPAKPSSPAKGPFQQGGGKCGRGRRKESIGAARPLDRWLLLGRKAGRTGSEDIEEAGE